MESSPQIAWYKTHSGKIFLGILSLGVLLVGGFFGLTGYYIYQIRSGNTSPPIKSASNKFTNAGGTSIDSAALAAIAQPMHQLIRSKNPTLGSRTAPVTIIAFIDFECPFCQESYATFKQVMEKYEGITQIIFKHFPITSIHPNSRLAALAADCAHAQGKFWPYYDTLFQKKTLDLDSLLQHAKSVSLEEKTFTTCLEKEAGSGTIDQDLADGASIGVRGTPTYVVNNQKIEGAIDLETWDRIILQALENK